MFGDHDKIIEEEENRFADLLKDDVDNFLASGVDSDFIFNSSDCSSPRPRHSLNILFRRSATPGTNVDTRFLTLSFILLSIVGIGVLFLFFSRLNSSSVHDSGFHRVNVANIELDGVDPVPEAEPTAIRFSSTNLYGRGIKALDSFSQKYWTDEVEVVLGMTDFLTSWTDMDERVSLSQTPNRNEDGDSTLGDSEFAVLPETFSPQEIVLATLSVSALVFTIEKYYNAADTRRGTEL